MLKTILLPVLLFLGSFTLLSAQTLPSLDPAIRTGTLDNGIRYYLMKNAKPENRVEMRLTVQAGSVQETAAEQGLAHLVEHLQFEGTERFGPQEIVGFLEANGMKFGNDLNAMTNFSDTQYFLDLPADQPKTLVKGLQILEDWAHGPQVVPAMLEKEKNIVAEEQRVRMENVQGRLTNFYLPILLGGTPYADRQPIGKMDVLAAVTPADVRRFVDRWYVPAGLSLQIVGAIDPAAVEAVLKKTFTKPFANAGLTPAGAAPVVPPYPASSTHDFKDPDLGANILVWNKVVPVDPLDQAAVQRLDLLNFVVNFTLSKRFTELTQSADPPFLQASVGASPLMGQAWLVQFQLVLRDGVADRSLDTFLTELRRLASHGLTPTDLTLALAEYRSIIDARYAQRDNTTNTDRATALAAYALTGEPAPSDRARYELRQAVAAGLTLADVNAALGSWLETAPSRLLVLSMDKPGVTVPSDAAIGAAIDRVAATAVAQAQERPIKPLFAVLPTPGKVTKAEKVAGTPLTLWTLSNGLKVYLYPNDFTKNEVQIRATAPGGLNRAAADQDYLSAAFSPYLFANTGLGDLSLPELTDFLTGHQASANLGVEDTQASLSASAVPADLEVLFQLVHKKFQTPRRDPGAETSFLQQVTESVKNQQNLPRQLYQNEIQKLLTGDAPRLRPVTVARLAEFQADKAARAYAALFTGAPGFTFTITGDFDEKTLKPLVETYLASLPVGKALAAKDLGVRPAQGPVTTVVKQGQDNKAEVTLSLPVAYGYSTANLYASWALKEVLDIRLREVVRQDKEGTYGVSVDISLSPFPYANAVTQVNFTCDKARQDELLAAVLGELKALAAGTIDDEVFAKALEIRKRAVETDQKTNGWWAWAVSQGLARGDDLKTLPTLAAFYGSLRKATLVAQAKALLAPTRALTVILNPADKP